MGAVQAAPETVFHLFSGTTLDTAAALMRLVEQGRVDLDAPATIYLGDLQLRHAVTLRQRALTPEGGVLTTRSTREMLTPQAQGAAGIT